MAVAGRWRERIPSQFIIIFHFESLCILCVCVCVFRVEAGMGCRLVRFACLACAQWIVLINEFSSLFVSSSLFCPFGGANHLPWFCQMKAFLGKWFCINTLLTMKLRVRVQNVTYASNERTGLSRHSPFWQTYHSFSFWIFNHFGQTIRQRFQMCPVCFVAIWVRVWISRVFLLLLWNSKPSNCSTRHQKRTNRSKKQS